jgi:hypothetical protein
MAAVVLLGLEHHERGVGEDGVVAPSAEQLALPGSGRGVKVLDAADDQPGSDSLPFLRAEGRVFHLGDLRIGDPAAKLVIPDGAGIADGDPGVFP